MCSSDLLSEAVQHGLGDFLVNAGFLSDGVDNLRFCECHNVLRFLDSVSGSYGPHTTSLQKWPLEGKKNKTVDEGLESGSKTTLRHAYCTALTWGHCILLQHFRNNRARGSKRVANRLEDARPSPFWASV